MGGVFELLLNGDPLWWGLFLFTLGLLTAIFRDNENCLAALSGYIGWIGLGFVLSVVDGFTSGSEILFTQVILAFLCLGYAAGTTFYNLYGNLIGGMTHFFISAIMVVVCWATFNTSEVATLIILAIVFGFYWIGIEALRSLYEMIFRR